MTLQASLWSQWFEEENFWKTINTSDNSGELLIVGKQTLCRICKLRERGRNWDCALKWSHIEPDQCSFLCNLVLPCCIGVFSGFWRVRYIRKSFHLGSRILFNLLNNSFIFPDLRMMFHMGRALCLGVSFLITVTFAFLFKWNKTVTNIFCWWSRYFSIQTKYW